MPDNNGGLQLLPETRRRIDLYTPGQNRGLYVALGILGLVLLTYGGLYFWQRQLVVHYTDSAKALQDAEHGRDLKQETALLQLKDRIALVKPLLNNHIAWSAAFVRIQRLIGPDIQFDSLNVKLDKNEYNFKAFAASYLAVAKQLAAFYADDAITDVVVGKLSALPTGKVEFTAQLTLDPNKTIKHTPTP